MCGCKQELFNLLLSQKGKYYMQGPISGPYITLGIFKEF